MSLEDLKRQVTELEASLAKLQKARAELDGPPVMMESIRPGMSADDAKRVAGAIVRALREDQ